MRKIALFLALAALIAFGAFYYYYDPSIFHREPPTASEGEEEEDFDHEELHAEVVILSPEQIQNAGLQVRMGTSGTIKKNLLVPGRVILNPEHYAHLVTPTAGVVKESRKNFGDHVEAGEVIAVLESHDVAEAKAQFMTSKHRLDLAATVFQQERQLYSKGIAPGEDLYKAEALLKEAVVNHDLAKQRLMSLGMTDTDMESLERGNSAHLSRFEIRSPLSGTILEKHLTVGETIPTGHEIFVIANLKEVWVEFSVYPKDIQGIRLGGTFDLAMEGAKVRQAKVFHISPVMDAETGRIKVLATLKNTSGKWRPGMYVEGNRVVEEFSAPLVVPKEAIVQMDNTDCIFVATTEGFEKRCVSTGRSDKQFAEIIAGLFPGERYVAKNANLLKLEMTKGEHSHEH